VRFASILRLTAVKTHGLVPGKFTLFFFSMPAANSDINFVKTTAFKGESPATKFFVNNSDLTAGNAAIVSKQTLWQR
jgi:hypothetical protein